MQKLIMLLILGLASVGYSYTFEWNGLFRTEYFQVDNTSLDSPANGKNYLLNYLSLSPRLTISDGYEVTARFDVMPNSVWQNSNLGQAWGQGNKSAAAATSADDSVSLAQSQNASTLLVKEMYLTLKQEFGAFIVGRAPFQFGLGMNHNAGRGAFDHWTDTYDMVALRILSGNLSVTPMLAKVYDPSVDQGADISDQAIVFDYDNSDTGSQIAVMLQERSGHTNVSEYPASIGGTVASRVKTRNVNFMLGRRFESFHFKMEAGFSSGSTGASTGTGEDILMNGYGIALEVMERPSTDSKWSWGLKTGVATGDNPTSADFEGYAFDRNYDVALLMFNHPLGQYDILKTSLFRGTAINKDSFDTESIGNAVYLAPELTYKSSDKLSYRGALIFGQLMSSDYAGGDVSKNLGSELDFSVSYKPSSRIEWINQLGYFMPGSAYEGLGGFKMKPSFGFTSKAAITF